MNRKASALATVLFLLALAASAFGQKPQPSPVLPDNRILGPELIAWSELQHPRPVPQPLPDPPDQQPQQQPVQADTSQSQQPAAQTFTGTIVKDGSKYVLKDAAGKAYQLDDQDKAKQYAGKQVKIVGNLDTNSNTLHVASIQPIS